MSFSGIITALAAPFKDGRLDEISFVRLLQKQTEAGVRAFVLAGTTGESPVLTESEKAILARRFREFERESKLRLQMIVASGSFSSVATIEKSKRAEGDLGADGLLIVTPYYNRPSQKGLRLHFEAAAAAVSLPVLLYNVPSRTACSLEAETAAALSETENIAGVKEASGDMNLMRKLKQLCPPDFALLSGDDLSCLDFFRLGGDGAISAASNILPQEFVRFFQDPEGQSEEFERHKNFFQELFRETNPVGVKQILFETGIIDSPELRLPLTAISNPKLSQTFQELNRLKNQEPGRCETLTP